MSTLKRKLLRSGCGIGLLAAPVVALAQETPAAETPAAPTDTTASSEVVTLEEFIVRESGAQSLDSLLPTDRPVGGAFLGNINVLELPRSATILGPEAMRQLSVQGFDDLDRVGAGLSRPNIFGIPGLPFIRGDNASVFFNGMMRIPNQNETPTSFGSFESLEIIKGPAPAHYGPTNAGGYVSTIPKTPYFDEERGSVEITYGSEGLYRIQADVGGPFELLGKPMAYRVSVTQQQADTYYDNVKNDYTSVYAALKGQLTPKLTFFTGGEYYNFKSNENAGWNRLTQDLVNNSNYIIGDADPNLIASTGPYAGFADVSLIGGFTDDQQFSAFTGTYNPDLALVVRAADFQAVFGAPDAGNAYSSGPASFMTLVDVGGDFYGYKYTPGYFANGGTALTKKISGSTVLSDRNDYANSQIGIWFGDLEWQGDNRKITLKSFIESSETEKFSSYGFAHDSEGYAINEKLLVEEGFELGPVKFDVQYGVEWRRTQVNDANDFAYEPFSRRDITQSIIPTSVVLAGPVVGWDFVAGEKSQTDQYGAFLQTKMDYTKYLTIFAGARHELARFSVKPPDEAGGGPSTSGDEEYQNYSINPVLKITPWWSIYASLQEGIALQPGQTGSISGEANFIDAPFREVGTKLSLFENKLFVAVSAYEFEKTVFSRNITGSSESAYESSGYEVEIAYKPMNRFTLLGSFGHQSSNYKGDFPFTTFPLSEEDIALTSGAIQYGPFFDGDFAGFPGNSGFTQADYAARYANNPNRVREGYPRFTANLFGVYEFENGFGIGLGPQYKSGFFNDNERTIKLPSALVWNANLFWRGERWEVFARLNNILSEDYFIGSTFAPTMIVTKAETFNWEVSAKYKF